MQRCSIKFKNRSNIIAHYRQEHAGDSILCHICDWPIKTSERGGHHFITHHTKRHPNIPLPYDFEKTANELLQKGEDMITLCGLDRITKWRFPKNLSHCPVMKCLLTFETRSAAIDHFKVEHAHNHTLCSLCNKPISVLNERNWSRHHKRVHRTETGRTSNRRTVKVAKRVHCRICNKTISSRYFATHLNEVHSRKIVCPLKDCIFQTKRMQELRKHWTKKHGSLKFPGIRQSRFGYRISDQNRAEQTDVRVLLILFEIYFNNFFLIEPSIVRFKSKTANRGNG